MFIFLILVVKMKENIHNSFQDLKLVIYVVQVDK